MSLEMTIMAQMRNASSSTQRSDNDGGGDTSLQNSESTTSAMSDPLPWLIRNLRDKQKAGTQNSGMRNSNSRTRPQASKTQASMGDADPLG